MLSTHVWGRTWDTCPIQGKFVFLVSYVLLIVSLLAGFISGIVGIVQKRRLRMLAVIGLIAAGISFLIIGGMS